MSTTEKSVATEAEASAATQQLAHYIGLRPFAYAKLAASYKQPLAKTHEEAMAQAVYLSAHNPDFATRFEKEVVADRHFNFFRLFAAIATGGASEIAWRIADAAKKAKAARAAAAAQQQAAGQPATPAAVVADPVAAVAAAPTPAAAAVVDQQATSLHTPTPSAAGAKPKPEEGMWHKHKPAIIGGIVLGALFLGGLIFFLTRSKEAEK